MENENADIFFYDYVLLETMFYDGNFGKHYPSLTIIRLDDSVTNVSVTYKGPKYSTITILMDDRQEEITVETNNVSDTFKTIFKCLKGISEESAFNKKTTNLE